MTQSKIFTDFSRGMNTDDINPGPGWAKYMRDFVFTRRGVARRRYGRNAITGLFTVPGNGGENGAFQFGVHIWSDAAGGLQAVWDNSNEVWVLDTRDSIFETYDRRYSASRASGDEGQFVTGSIYGDEIITGHAIEDQDYGGAVPLTSSVSNQSPVRFGGSIKADYTTGTVSTTVGDKTITGSGTTWTANTEPGMYINISSGALGDRWFKIIKVTDNTHIEVDAAPDEASSGASYTITAVGRVSAPDNIFGFNGSMVNYPTAPVMFVHQDKIFAADVEEYDTETASSTRYRSRLRNSSEPDEAQGKYIGGDLWQEGASVDVGLGIGTKIMGGVSWGSSALIIKDRGIFLLAGNPSSDGSPSGAYIEQLSADIGVNSYMAITTCKVGVVWADERGLYLWSGGTGITNLLDGRMRTFWRDHNFGSTACIISSTHNRVIVYDGASGEGAEPVLVWDFEWDAFVTSTIVYAAIGKGVYTESNADALNTIYEIFPTSNGCMVNLYDDYTASDTEVDEQPFDTDLNAPKIKLQTPMIFADKGKFFRPSALSVVYTYGPLVDPGLDGSQLAAYFLSGLGEYDTAALATLDELPTDDKWTNIPISIGDAMASGRVSSASILLEENGPADGASSGACSIYAIELEIEEEYE